MKLKNRHKIAIGFGVIVVVAHIYDAVSNMAKKSKSQTSMDSTYYQFQESYWFPNDGKLEPNMPEGETDGEDIP